MFTIIYESEVIGFADTPIYIKNKDGVWVNATKEDAEGIAFESTPYPGAFAKEEESYRVMEIKDAAIEQAITDIEIAQIEDEQMLTDHDIAIMELQSREE